MVENKQPGYRQAFDTYIHLVKQTARFTSMTGKLALRSVAWGLELPDKVRQPVDQRIRAGRPLTEANIAVAAISDGKEKADPQLVAMGEAILVNAVHLAMTEPYVPSEIRDEVLRKAYDAKLDPANTLANPFAARDAERALEKFERIHESTFVASPFQ
jgi:hypothetical protein